MELSKVGLGGGLPRKCINVHQNGDFEHGRVLYVQPEWDMDALLNAVSQRLEIVPSARRLFNSDGIEIEDVLMIEDGAIVFVSSGRDFIVPTVDGLKFRGEDEEGRAGGGNRGGAGRRGSGDTIGGANKAASAGGTGGGGGKGTSASNIPAVVGGYIVGDLLGRGGFGEVRLGVHQLTQERVAMKFMHKSAIIASMGAAERAITEIQCLMALNHPNVIRLVQQFETPKYMVMAFELMEGGDLFRYLSSLPQSCMNEDEARNVFHQIVSAVSYAHNHHICHRDLKLENVLLSKEGSLQVKIADFGLSDFYPPGATRRSQCGSFSYLAPEVFKGTSNAGPPIDVWALGVMLFAMLCGRLPFDASTAKLGKNRNKKQQQPPPPQDTTLLDEETIIRNRIVKCQYKIDDGLTPEAKDLVRRMLKLDPSERASIPEITTHCWLRMRHSNIFDSMGSGGGAGGGKHHEKGHHRHGSVDHGERRSSSSSTSVGEGPLSITPLKGTLRRQQAAGDGPSPPQGPSSSSSPLLPPTSPIGSRSARLSPAPLTSPPIDVPSPLLSPGRGGDGLPSSSSSPSLLRGVSPVLLSDAPLPNGNKGGPPNPLLITPLSMSQRLQQGKDGGMTILFDAPLLTSPLHAKKKDGAAAASSSSSASSSALSFLEIPPAEPREDSWSTDDAKGSRNSPMNNGLGKSGLTGKSQSWGRMVEPGGAPVTLNLVERGLAGAVSPSSGRAAAKGPPGGRLESGVAPSSAGGKGGRHGSMGVSASAPRLGAKGLPVSPRSVEGSKDSDYDDAEAKGVGYGARSPISGSAGNLLVSMPTSPTTQLGGLRGVTSPVAEKGPGNSKGLLPLGELGSGRSGSLGPASSAEDLLSGGGAGGASKQLTPLVGRGGERSTTPTTPAKRRSGEPTGA